MTAEAGTPVIEDLRGRLRRAYLMLLVVVAGAVGSVLGLYVTPHLGKVIAVLGTIALLTYLVVIVARFFRAPWPEEMVQIAGATGPVLLSVVDDAPSVTAPEGRSWRIDTAESTPPVPRVQLLGPVRVLNPQGVTPTSEIGRKQWNSQVLRATELIAFLVTHRGAMTKAVHEAMWGIGADVRQGTQSRNKLTNSARRWLGTDPLGREYFPDARGGMYDLLGAVRSDWDDWVDLVGTAPASAATTQLVRALALVKGQPFSDVKDRYYAWAMNELKPMMVAAIADAAHELSTRSLRAGDLRLARGSAAKGCMVEPENETHWRNALRAELQAGDRSGAERVLAQLEVTMKQMGFAADDLEQETQELVAKVRGRSA